MSTAPENRSWAARCLKYSSSTSVQRMTSFPSAPSCSGNLRLAVEESRGLRCPFEATWPHLRTIVAITSAYCEACQPGQDELLTATCVSSGPGTECLHER